MNEYRRKLKFQNILFIIGALALTAVQVLAHTGVIQPALSASELSDFGNGFIAGVAAGLTLLIVIGIIINLRAMKSDERLKKLYCKENDERAKLIAEKGKSSAASAFVFSLLIASIISGFFNFTVFVTLLISTFALALYMCFGKLYYNKKL